MAFPEPRRGPRGAGADPGPGSPPAPPGPPGRSDPRRCPGCFQARRPIDPGCDRAALPTRRMPSGRPPPPAAPGICAAHRFVRLSKIEAECRAIGAAGASELGRAPGREDFSVARRSPGRPRWLFDAAPRPEPERHPRVGLGRVRSRRPGGRRLPFLPPLPAGRGIVSGPAWPGASPRLRCAASEPEVGRVPRAGKFWRPGRSLPRRGRLGPARPGGPQPAPVDLEWVWDVMEPASGGAPAPFFWILGSARVGTRRGSGAEGCAGPRPSAPTPVPALRPPPPALRPPPPALGGAPRQGAPAVPWARGFPLPGGAPGGRATGGQGCPAGAGAGASGTGAGWVGWRRRAALRTQPTRPTRPPPPPRPARLRRPFRCAARTGRGGRAALRAAPEPGLRRG